MRKWFLISALGFALIGCGNKTNNLGPVTIVGNWLLVSQNGAAVAEQDSYFEVYAATTYQQLNVRPARNVAVTGTYVAQSNTLTQTQSTGAVLTYEIRELSATRLLVVSQRSGTVYEYRKTTDAERETIFNRN